MPLTPEDVKALNAIFAPEQHEFNRGFVYITERAVCDRLEAVDPSWNFDLKSIQVRDSDVVVVGTLTIKGVTREGVGMQKIMEKAGEAEKGAATDALKRAARLFGVGRYLLDAPEERQFGAWLARLTPGKAAQLSGAEIAAIKARAEALQIDKATLGHLLKIGTKWSECPFSQDAAIALLEAHATALKNGVAS